LFESNRQETVADYGQSATPAENPRLVSWLICDPHEGHEGMLWNAIMAPAGTPQAVIDRLAAASAKAARAPDIIEKLQREGVDLVGGTPADLATLIARELRQ
jgi:hypothetical protein